MIQLLKPITFCCKECDNKQEEEFLVNRQKNFVVCLICGYWRQIENDKA